MAQNTPTRDQVEPESDRVGKSSPELASQITRDSLPSSDWLSLDDHEKLLWEDSPSVKTLLPDLGMSIVLVAIGVILASIGAGQLVDGVPSSFQVVAVAVGGIVVIAGIGLLFINYWSYRRRHYAITTEAIYRRWDGSTTKIKATDICEVLCEQSWLDRQFSCGDLKVGWSKNGKEKTTYPAVPHPNQAKNRLFEVTESQLKNS